MRSARRKGWNMSLPACDRSSNGGSTLTTKWMGAGSLRERKNSGSQSLPGQMRTERRRMTVWVICTHVSKNISTTYVLKGACQLIFSHLCSAPVCSHAGDMTLIQFGGLGVGKSLPPLNMSGSHQVIPVWVTYGVRGGIQDLLGFALGLCACCVSQWVSCSLAGVGKAVPLTHGWKTLPCHRRVEL